jgi:K+ transporter
MYDTIKCGFFASSVTLFANVPGMFEWPLEKIGFGALLFFIIWTYMKQVLPKTQEAMRQLREENRKLLDEVAKLNQLRERDQKLIALYLKETKQYIEEGKSKSGIRAADNPTQTEVNR